MHIITYTKNPQKKSKPPNRQTAMRAILRKIALDILSIASRPSANIHILNGHFIEEQESDLSERHFEIFITEMMKYFQIIDLDEAISLIEKKKLTRQKLR